MIIRRSLHGPQVGPHPLRHLRLAQGVHQAACEAEGVLAIEEGEEVIVCCVCLYVTLTPVSHIQRADLRLLSKWN